MYINENAKRRRMYQTLCTNSEGITKSVFLKKEDVTLKSFAFVSIENMCEGICRVRFQEFVKNSL